MVVGIVVGALLASTAPTKAIGHGIRHRFVSAVADSTDPRQVQPSHWNDEHVFETIPFGLMVAPSAPIDGDCWAEAAGTSPSRTIAWKCRDNGVTRLIASATF